MAISTTVDMVVHFAGVPEKERAAYWDLNLDMLGFEDEYERPIAWLVDALTEDGRGMGSAMVRGASPDFNDGDIDDWDVCVKARRYDVSTDEQLATYTRPWHWSQADFDTLTAAVPWLKPDDPDEPRDTSRMPGPNDRPLFDLPPEGT